MTTTILYFAAVRDIVGRDEERLELPASVTTVGELATHLARVHPALAGRLDAVRFARNEVLASSSELLADDDVIALIPPVCGG